MKEFTFVMLTYNQEQYVIEHLESIKYQIENFGNNIKINFILADDSSQDNTVDMTKKWIEDNKELFFSCNFIVSRENKGIVNNITTALKNIQTEYYKILAGDDLYFKNNIFEIFSSNDDIYFTPVIRFDGTNLINTDSKWFFKELLAFQYNKCDMQKIILKSLKYSMNLESPGLFIKKSLVMDSVYNILKRFHYIDDVPFIYSVLQRNQVKVLVVDKPYILYRVQSGISTAKKHSKYKLFIEEYKIIRNEIFTKQRKNKYLNWFKYEYKIKDFLYRYNIIQRKNKVIQNFRMNMQKEERLAIEYIKLINKRAKQWKMQQGDKYVKMHRN